ncbi:hypothetical protein GJ496_011470 [Pomphorhynchus laevis]|nr:hypothetical protein GJ496_011470 [Pomphorhynchus laevis]
MGKLCDCISKKSNNEVENNYARGINCKSKIDNSFTCVKETKDASQQTTIRRTINKSTMIDEMLKISISTSTTLQTKFHKSACQTQKRKQYDKAPLNIKNRSYKCQLSAECKNFSTVDNDIRSTQLISFHKVLKFN